MRMPEPAPHDPEVRWSREAEKHASLFREFHIPPRFHAAFAEFVETGEVRDSASEFLHALERDPSCQQALEKAFRGRREGLQNALRALTP